MLVSRVYSILSQDIDKETGNATYNSILCTYDSREEALSFIKQEYMNRQDKVVSTKSDIKNGLLTIDRGLEYTVYTLISSNYYRFKE